MGYNLRKFLILKLKIGTKIGSTLKKFLFNSFQTINERNEDNNL